jgi:hypothetical protein
VRRQLWRDWVTSVVATTTARRGSARRGVHLYLAGRGNSSQPVGCDQSGRRHAFFNYVLKTCGLPFLLDHIARGSECYDLVFHMQVTNCCSKILLQLNLHDPVMPATLRYILPPAFYPQMQNSIEYPFPCTAWIICTISVGLHRYTFSMKDARKSNVNKWMHFVNPVTRSWSAFCLMVKWVYI